MRDIFVFLVNMSITASWLIAFVLFSRLFLKKSSRLVFCFLWILVGIRLFIPGLFESAWSLIPESETFVVTKLDTALRMLNANILVQGFKHSVNMVTSIRYVDMAVKIWILGAAIFMGYGIYSYYQLKKKVAASIEIENGVLVCDDIDSAFIMGILNPKIYLPSSLEFKEKFYVLAHEKMHLRRKDYLLKPLGYILLVLHWFNPLVWFAYILFSKDIEMACDEQVIQNMNADDVKEYARTLLMFGSQYKLLACPVAFAEVGVKERVMSILEYKKPSIRIMLVSILTCLFCMACFMPNPKDNFGLTDQFLYVSFTSSPTYEDPVGHVPDDMMEMVFANHWEMKDMIEIVNKGPRAVFYHDWYDKKITSIILECLDEDSFSYTFYHCPNNYIWPEDDITKEYSVTFSFERDKKGVFAVEVEFSEAMENYKDQLVVCELLNAEEAEAKALEYGIEDFLKPEPAGE